MQKSKREFLKTTATIGAFLVSTVILPAHRVLAVENTESENLKPPSGTRIFPLDYQQILKYLRAANDVAKEAADFGHHPFGAVLVAPNGDRMLMKQGNLSSMQHAETELSRRAFAQYNPDYLWGCTLVTTFEPCVMCAGNIYWANIGNLVYGVEETTLKKLTGTNKDNPTMNLPCRTVFEAGQKPILVAGPFPELEDELAAPHRTFWK
ncbi:nucleoside deaminase [Desulfolutivibrio sulfoxidireducens]|nr:nucleoside deaminase [Desulfolutivibrio sulfoxidireducens]